MNSMSNKSKWHVSTQSKWHVAMGSICPQCGKPMVGNDCPACGHADEMGSTDMNYQNPGTGLSPNPDMMPPGNPVSAKWHIAYGEQQQPGGVATPPPSPDEDPNYLPMDDVGAMSYDQELAYQKLVDHAVDELNRGISEEQILAELMHMKIPDPVSILERAKQQPVNTNGNLQNDPQEQPPSGDAMVNNSGASGMGDSVSQPPAFQASVKGTDTTGKVEAQWEDMYGQQFSRIRTATGTHDVLTENIEPITQMEVDPVNVINELINSMPTLEQTKASVQRRIAHLKEASRLCRKALYGNLDNDQMQKIADIEASTHTAILNLTDAMHKFQPSMDDYLASQRPFSYDGYGLEEMLTTETTAHINTSTYDRLMDEHPKLVVHDLSDAEKIDALTVRRTASDYISQYVWELPPKLRQSMTEEFIEAALAEARKFKPAPIEKTASVEEPIENFDGPAASLYLPSN